MMPAGSAQSEAQSINIQGSSTALSTSSTLVASDDDPDILVLGFQELDLSTEALLYSTNTAREDAWCLAVFAGLGEKRSQYVKVRYPRNFGLFYLALAS
jgi:inositol polyphosphate 5-phosphatase INPP5B/F